MLAAYPNLALALSSRQPSEHPAANVQLTVENTAAIAAKVRNFELDIGLIEGELQDPDLEVVFW